MRTIYRADVVRDGEEIRIIFEGDGFLYNMVRIMAGTLVEIGMKKRSDESIDEVFETKIRENAGRTMPAKGLTLVDVSYGED